MIAYFAAALIAGAPIPTDEVSAAAALFDTVCLQVRDNREAFEALAEARGWTPVDLDLNGRDWVVGYRAGDLLVRFSQSPGADSKMGPQRICAVDHIEAGADWQQALTTLQVDGRALGPSTTPGSNYQLPPGMEVRFWDLDDGSRVHGTFIAARSYLELSVNYPAGR